ncbi:MAG: metallophosphoesterase [Myxococcales bacterium]|nr:metallophosphoesterase [Myxococcales bacterium]MDH3484161.1 metallophosphoesterase [Myxococcales bacterium]
MNGASTQAATIGVIGDVHLFWDAEDVAFFNRSNYDMLLFVGDLAAYTQVRGLGVARSLGKLRTPALCIPGNHDGLHALQLGAEITPRAHRLRNVFCQGQDWRCNNLDRALGDVKLVAYSRQKVELSGIAFNLVVCRPHSIGGRRVACLRYLAKKYGVDSMDASSARLRALIDQCDDAPIVFLAHNGPSGLGDRADSIWGCDFRKQEEDWGDPDLEEAVRHAKDQGRAVLATVAGHMHRRTKSGKNRPGQITKGGTLYINAAEVPRHRIKQGAMKRHHVELTLTHTTATAKDIWI